MTKQQELHESRSSKEDRHEVQPSNLLGDLGVASNPMLAGPSPMQKPQTIAI